MPCMEVEQYIQEYTLRMIRKEMIDKEDVLWFLEECRKMFQADVFCVCETLLGGYGFSFPYLACSKSEYNFMGKKIVMNRERMESICSKYGSEGLSEERFGFFPEMRSYTGLNYAIVSGSRIDGCIAMAVCDMTRVWTEDEREAMKKIGRLLRTVVQNSRWEKIDLKEYNEVLEALSAEYTSIYSVDLEREKIYLFHTRISGNATLDKINHEADYWRLMHTYVNQGVYVEDKDEFVKNVSTERVRAELANNDVYDVNYRRVLFGKLEHAQMRFLRVAGSEGKVVVAMRSVDDIVRKEQQRMEVIRGLSQDYSTIFLVDIEHEEMYPYRISEYVSDIYAEDAKEFLSTGVQRYLERMVHPDDREIFRQTMNMEKIRAELSKDRVHYMKYRCIIGGQEVHYLQQIINVSKYKDEVTQLIYAYKNIEKEYQEEIKQKKQLEELLVKANVASESKSAFLFNMSHDIRTPMNAIVGFANIAQEHIEDKKVLKNALDKISSSSEILLKLVNDVLDLARIESGKVIAEMTPRNIVNDMLEIYTMFEDEMQEAGIDFSIETHVRKPYVISDFLHISQICINLLSNAKKFTKTGGRVRMAVTQLSDVKNGCADYEIKIADTGIGMSREFQKKVFMEFERERTTTQSGIQGTGLGLAIVHRLVDILGGTLDFHSQLGVGSEFIVTLQLQVTDNDAITVKREKNECTLDFSAIRILLVEDNEINTEIAVMILEDLGMSVECAENGAVAVRMLEDAQEGYYDIILMDIQMPVLDGYQATRVIRGLKNQSLAKIPIVAMTANAFEEDCQKSLEIGMNAHIAKPIKTEVIKCTLNKVLAERKIG